MAPNGAVSGPGLCGERGGGAGAELCKVVVWANIIASPCPRIPAPPPIHLLYGYILSRLDLRQHTHSLKRSVAKTSHRSFIMGRAVLAGLDEHGERFIRMTMRLSLRTSCLIPPFNPLHYILHCSEPFIYMHNNLSLEERRATKLPSWGKKNRMAICLWANPGFALNQTNVSLQIN